MVIENFAEESTWCKVFEISGHTANLGFITKLCLKPLKGIKINMYFLYFLLLVHEPCLVLSSLEQRARSSEAVYAVV